MTYYAKTFSLMGEEYFLKVYLDLFNKRIRIDDLSGNIYQVIEKAEELAAMNQSEKLIFKVRFEQFAAFFEKGFLPEAMIDQYFCGSACYLFSKFYTAERKKNDHWMTEDQIIKSVSELKPTKNTRALASGYQLKKADENVADELAALYKQVFPIYPTPIYDPEYVKKTMGEGTIYMVFYEKEKMVSAASAEINFIDQNAELTDCATLPEHRKNGLIKVLLLELEEELKKKHIYCSYSIARSLSFGMNAVLSQLGYQYRGRLQNNCYIYDKLEDMNMWVKNLADC